MDTNLVTTSNIIFAAAAVIISIALSVISKSWNLLIAIISSLPSDKRKLRAFWDIKDVLEKNKQESFWIQLVAIICFGIVIALALFAVIGVISQMLSYNFGFYQQENYDFGKGCLYTSAFFIFLGFFLIGLNYILRIVSIIKGNTDPLTSDLVTMKPINESSIVISRKWGSRGIGLIILTLITYGLLIFFNQFSSWQIVLIIIGVIVLYVLIFILCDWYKQQHKNKDSISKNHPTNTY